MPIGDGAQYVPAHIHRAHSFSVDEEVLILTPDAPLTKMYKTTAGWSRDITRCAAKTSELMREIPVPHDFNTEGTYLGLTPNQSAAIILQDGKTVIQNQPFHRCGVGGDELC